MVTSQGEDAAGSVVAAALVFLTDSSEADFCPKVLTALIASEVLGEID